MTTGRITAIAIFSLIGVLLVVSFPPFSKVKTSKNPTAVTNVNGWVGNVVGINQL